MAEFAIASNDKKLFQRTIDTWKNFGTKTIEGKGSFISYQVGGAGAAFLKLSLYLATDLGEQVAGSSKRMFQNQKRSGEGLLFSGWVSDSLTRFSLIWPSWSHLGCYTAV